MSRGYELTDDKDYLLPGVADKIYNMKIEYDRELLLKQINDIIGMMNKNSGIFYPHGLGNEPVKERKFLTNPEQGGMWIVTEHGQYHTNHIYDIQLEWQFDGQGGTKSVSVVGEESNGKSTYIVGDQMLMQELYRDLFAALTSGRSRFSIPEWIKWYADK